MVDASLVKLPWDDCRRTLHKKFVGLKMAAILKILKY